MDEKGFPTPPGIQELSPEQRQLVKSASAKYSDPIRKVFELETKKGTNSFNLTLTIP
jgi:hypothetical protein